MAIPKKFSKKCSGPKSGASLLNDKLTDFQCYVHQYVLSQIWIELSVYEAMIVNKRGVQIDYFKKIIMVACDCTLEGDSK